MSAQTPSHRSEQDVTQWLHALAVAGPAGDAEAAGQVVRLLYDELHRMARAQLRHEPEAQTLTPTALVSEAWLRLSAQTRSAWQGRQHYLAVAAMMMRRILVDQALARRAAKRDAMLQPLDTQALADVERAAVAGPAAADAAAVHEALMAFEHLDPRAARVVELRFFGGLEVQEIAALLAVSPATVNRDWAAARAWLRRELGGSGLPA